MCNRAQTTEDSLYCNLRDSASKFVYKRFTRGNEVSYLHHTNFFNANTAYKTNFYRFMVSFDTKTAVDR